MAKEKRVKIGFIGCGAHATSSLYPTIHTIPEIDLAAVSDLKEELAEKNARDFGARKWYTSAEEMLSKEELDGAVIVGPPQMHYELGKKCLAAGLPIFVEKPSAISSILARELAEYAEEKGLLGTVAFMKRHSTCYRMAKAITEKKEFGNINEIEIRLANGRYPAIWGIEDPAKAFLVGQCVHVFDLIRFFCGEVEEVYSRLNIVDRIGNDGIHGFAVTVAFKSGAVGVMNINCLQGYEFQMSEYFLACGYECWVESQDMVSLNYYAREKQMPEFNPHGRAQVFSWKPEYTEFLASKAEGMAGYRGELQNFARAILGTEELRADLYDGAKALEIAEAIWESSQSKKPVTIA